MNNRVIGILVLAVLASAMGFAMSANAQPPGADARRNLPSATARATNEDFLRQYAETYRFSLGRPSEKR